MRERTPAWLLGRVRDLAMALPETDEVTSHGMPCFGIVRAKTFAYFTEVHHGDGKIALLVKISGADAQAKLIEMDADRSEERRVGKECVRPCTFKWSPLHSQQNNVHKPR